MSFPVTTMTHTGTAVSTVSIEVVGNDEYRTYLLILNQGSGAAWIRSDGGTAVADNTAERLLPGESMEPKPNMTASSVTAISLTGTIIHVVSGGPPAPILFEDVIVTAGDTVIVTAGDIVQVAA